MILKSFEDLVDDAVHAALQQLGLSVVNHIEAAGRLHDFITFEFKGIVTDDDDE